MGLGRTAAAPANLAPFTDRRRDRPVKREAVLRTAAQLFLELGYHGTTLNDVAKRLRITKPALYNYFQSKEEILFECYRLGFEMVELAIAETASRKGSGLDKLGAVFRAYIGVMSADFGMCLVRVDDRELSDEARAHIRKDKRKLDRRFRAIVTEGIRDGSILPCDAKLAAFTLAGSANWIGHWYQPGGAWAASDIAEKMTLQLLNGLAVRRIRPALEPRAPRKVLP